MHAEATTIKVSKELRDRLAQRAAAEGVSTARVVARLLEAQERRERWEAVAKAYAERDESYLAERRSWDVTLADGLGGWPG